MKRLNLVPHLSVADVEAHYRRATDPVARSQWHIIWLLTQGVSTHQVVQYTGYSPTWIYTIVRRSNARGPAGIGDRRHTNPGTAGLLSPAQQQELATALTGPAPDGGVWTSTKVAAWMAAKLGRPVHPPRGWEWLRRLGYRPYVPRPRHAKADAGAQEQFKTNPAGRASRRAHRPSRCHHRGVDDG